MKLNFHPYLYSAVVFGIGTFYPGYLRQNAIGSKRLDRHVPRDDFRQSYSWTLLTCSRVVKSELVKSIQLSRYSQLKQGSTVFHLITLYSKDLYNSLHRVSLWEGRGYRVSEWLLSESLEHVYRIAQVRILCKYFFMIFIRISILYSILCFSLCILHGIGYGI